MSPADGTAIAFLDGMRRNVQAHAIALWVVGLACVPGSHDARARSLRSLDLDAAGHEAAASPRISDPQLMAHVQAALAAQDLAHDDVRFAATKGVVELTGVVPTLLAYDRVASVARRVRGVRSLSNRLVVAPRVVADERLHEQVAAVLQEAEFDADVRAHVVRGVVTLEGDVHSWQEHGRVRRAVKGIPGVRGVVELVHVTPGSRTDAAIARDVIDALRWDGLVDLRDLRVAVVDGHVRLAGRVRGPSEARVAERVAWLEGVRAVDGRALTVPAGSEEPLWWQPARSAVDDAEIAEAIDLATTIDPRIVGTGVTARVAAGVVTLHGVVPRLAARQAAEQIAADTPGVRKVVNRLVVRATEPRIDEIVAARVETALARDLATNTKEIAVTVREGTVVLHGTVDTAEEIARAERLAQAVHGVKSVENRVVERFREVDDRLEVRAWATPYQPYAAPVAQYRRVHVRPSATELADNVRRQLYWSPFVDLGKIRIDVVDDRVVLSGEVESWRERRYAIENAYEGGATIVEDRLTIRRG